MTQNAVLFGALLSALVPASATAADPLLDPLYVRNFSPVAGLFGLPAQRDASTTPAGTLQWALHAGVASHYVRDRAGIEQINLDGETQRLALELRYGLAEDWDVQLELPWLRQDGGSLDGAIDGWHELWGMPDNGRSDAPRDRIDYRYADPELRFAVLGSGSGIGDGSLALQRRLYRDGGVEVAASLGYKFGSGDAGDFTGSGEGDVYAALRAAGSGAGALGWYAQAGYLRAGEIAELGPRQERDLWFAGAGLAWRLSSSWSLLAQLDAHAAPMDSALDALGSDAVMLSAGARWRFAPRWAVDVSLVEDIAVETAPDVIFQASLRYLGEGG